MGQKLPIIVVILLLSLHFAFAQQEDSSLMSTRVTLQTENLPLSAVLDSIACQTGFFFSYEPDLLGSNRQVSVSFSGTLLEKVLFTLLGANFEWHIRNNQIVIAPKTVPIPVPVTDQVPDSFLTLNGRVVDLDNNAPIPYASVSLFGKPIGTITNSDGEFSLKIQQERNRDTLIFSCLGYQKYFLPVNDFDLEKNSIFLRPVSIKIKEIKVKAVQARTVIEEAIAQVKNNYPTESYLMTSFYRETLQQNEKYMNVSEAVMEILKSPYSSEFSEDRTRVIKGRKNKQEKLFRWVDFKIQGGPYYITFLDVVKTRESFLDQHFLDNYRYEIEEVILYRDRPTFVIGFKPSGRHEDIYYQGKLYIDRETHAVIQINFSLDNSGLKKARQSMIKKKPRGFHVRPERVNYQVVFQPDRGKWMLHTARAHVVFKVRSRDDKVNAYYTSISDLLITDYRPSEIKRFKHAEVFHPDDIFTETIISYDESFWGQYNTIKPNEDLRKAIRSQNNETN